MLGQNRARMFWSGMRSCHKNKEGLPWQSRGSHSLHFFKRSVLQVALVLNEWQVCRTQRRWPNCHFLWWHAPSVVADWNNCRRRELFAAIVELYCDVCKWQLQYRNDIVYK